MPQPPGEWNVMGWSAIGEVVGLHGDTARAYASEREDPIPVAKVFGRVVAKRAELESWATRRVGPRCPTCGCRATPRK